MRLRLSILACLVFPIASGAQTRDGEIVANLAAGRVIIDVTHDGIVIGTIEEPLEPGSLPPRFVDVGGARVAVMLGAVEWARPGAEAKSARVERGVQPLSGNDNLDRQAAPYAASDIEAIGVEFLEHVRPLVARLHNKLSLGLDEPIFEVVLADYAPDEVPEVWLLRYRVRQVFLRDDYYQTNVLRPSYTQLYPPEKHAPRTLIEVRYPESDSSNPSATRAEREESLLDLLRGQDPRFVRAGSSDAKVARVIEQIKSGKSQDSHLADAEDFMHAALAILAGTQNMAFGVLTEERGFGWVVPPSEPLQKAEETNRPANAPSLRHRPY
jgi:hypothetical protein